MDFTYVSRVAFQERAGEGSHSLQGQEGAGYTGPMAPSCLPGVHLNCDQDQVGHPYLFPGNEPPWMEIPCMQRKLSCLDPG